jgi:hypothetical protein
VKRGTMMKEDVAVATSGIIPISSITGPFTIPEPGHIIIINSFINY